MGREQYLPSTVGEPITYVVPRLTCGRCGVRLVNREAWWRGKDRWVCRECHEPEEWGSREMREPPPPGQEFMA